MSSLDDVVAAMCKETNDSTLGWDVVVNYSATEINALLKAAYDKGHKGQLMDLPVQLTEMDMNGETYKMDFDFKLGAPLIQFLDSAMVPACSLDIPIIGGSVKSSGRVWTIRPDVYSVHVLGILLASVEGTNDNRKLTPSHESFVFNSSNVTGAVTLDFATSISREWLKVELVAAKEDIRYIDNRLESLAGKVLSFFSTSPNSINYDLAQVNNSRVLDLSGTILVPKSFRFAVYSPTESNNHGILSLFIETEGGRRGAQSNMQSIWISQWLKHYGVPPIPQSYTASVIFNNALIKNLVEKSVCDQGLKIEEFYKTTNDTWGIKWKILTGKRFTVDRMRETRNSVIYGVDGASVDLDRESNGLYMTFGQNDGLNAQPSALLEWEFSLTMGLAGLIPAIFQAGLGGKVKITDKLNTKKYFENFKSQVLLDASFKEGDWDSPRIEPNGPNPFNHEFPLTQPGLPSLNLKLFNIDFFMTTNLLLPNRSMINFETNQGLRIPRDLYLVGHIVDARAS